MKVDPTKADPKIMAEALAGWIACAAMNGHYIDEDMKAWCGAILMGSKTTPVQNLRTVMEQTTVG